MSLHLLDDIVGTNSFWNLTAPAVALCVFRIGRFTWFIVKRDGAFRLGCIVTFAGVLAFLLACTVDGVRNLHDIEALRSAVHDRYDLQLDDAEATDLLDAGAPRPVTVAGIFAAVIPLGTVLLRRAIVRRGERRG